MILATVLLSTALVGSLIMLYRAIRGRRQPLPLPPLQPAGGSKASATTPAAKKKDGMSGLAKLGTGIVMIIVAILLSPIIATVLYVVYGACVIIFGFCTLLLSGAEEVRAAVSAPRPIIEVVVEDKGRPLTDSERIRLVRNYQTEPVATRLWEVSSPQRSLTVDRSAGKPQQVFVMNACYARQVTYEVTAGNFGAGAEQPLLLVQSPHDSGRELHGTTGLRHGEKDRRSLEQVAALHVRWEHPPYKDLDPEKNISLYFSNLQDDVLPGGEKTAVIRTQGRLPRGYAVPWGAIPTHYEGEKLAVEGTIVFLDYEGQYLTATTGPEAPLLWHVPSDKTELTAAEEPAYRVDCTAPIHPIRISDADALADRRLWVMMPTGGYCFVNWKITGIIEEE